MSLESQAIFWLRFTKRCQMVLTERTPLELYGSRPDVLGITKARYAIEIECKRTMSDFRANQRKHHVANRDQMLSRWPKLFYFMVPDSMAPRVLMELPEWAGLLGGTDSHVLRVHRESPANLQSKRLTLKQCCHAVQLIVNELHWGDSRSHHRWASQELSELDYTI